MDRKIEHKKEFGAADFERYYTGKMLPEEMHELEKAALDNAFLADALDGYAHTRTAVADMADLKSRLHSKKSQAKVVAFSKKSTYNYLFKGAAMFVFILGAAWLLYQFAFKQNENTISYQNTTEINTPKKVNDSLANRPAIRNEQAEKNEVNPNIKLTETLTQRKNNTPALPNFNNQMADSQKPEIANVPPDDSYVAAPSIEPNRDQEVVSDVVAMPQKKTTMAEATVPAMPVPNENVTRKLASTAKRLSNDRNDSVEINNKGNQVVFTIKKAPDGINEIVLHQKNKDSLYKKMPCVTVEEVEPEESWSEFGEYLSDNLKMPGELETSPLSGTVKLTFDVNQSGEAVNIHVEKSRCSKCEAEALRLIKEGPKWKLNSKKGKVIIQF